MNSAFLRGFARNLRDGGIASAAWYLRAPNILKSINLPASGKLQGEIHVLSGKERLIMALWMAASWMAATGARWHFVFHDDGTLGQRDADEVHRVLPDSRVILDVESSRELRVALADYPMSWQCRNLHPLCRKLFDIPHYAKGSRFLTIDTDILFFRKPHQLLEWLERSDPVTLFLEDVADATIPSAASAAEKLGCKIIRKVNTGIVAMPKAAVALKDLEKCLSETRLMKEDRWYIEQSLYALLASLHGDVEFLEEGYYMPISGGVPDAAIARHYMGKIRHLFYSEGMPRVAEMLRSSCGGDSGCTG